MTLPSRTDPTAARAVSGVLGGAWGRYAAVRMGRWWSPVRVLLAMTVVTLGLAFVQKAPCATGDWSGFKQYTHLCYNDVVPLWSDERLDIGAVPYRDTAIEYPVLTGAMMWIAALLTRAATTAIDSWSQVFIFDSATSVLLAICALLLTAALAATAGRRPYDAAIFALSPLLVFHAFSNWDLLAMCLATGALWAWSRDKTVLAGVFIGLGTAAKLYPALLLVPIVILAVRTRRYAPAGWAIAAAALSWITVNIPVALAYRDAWWEFYRFSMDRPAERSTVWAILETMRSGGLDTSDAPFYRPSGTAVALLLFAALLIVAYLGLRAPTRPRMAQLGFLAVLAFLLTTKVWSPQYSLWLVPLLALARPRWRMNLIWQASEIAVWALTLTLLLGLNEGQSAHGVSYGLLVGALLVRDVLLLALAALIVRDMWRPDLDVVRDGGVDDPGGGPFDRAADARAR